MPWVLGATWPRRWCVGHALPRAASRSALVLRCGMGGLQLPGGCRRDWHGLVCTASLAFRPRGFNLSDACQGSKQLASDPGRAWRDLRDPTGAQALFASLFESGAPNDFNAAVVRLRPGWARVGQLRPATANVSTKSVCVWSSLAQSSSILSPNFVQHSLKSADRRPKLEHQQLLIDSGFALISPSAPGPIFQSTCRDSMRSYFG